MKVTKLLIVLGILAVVGVGAYLGSTQFGRLCTALAITDFRARPSAAGAQTLADLVDNGSATAQQVEQILPLLFTPKMTKDKVYLLGDVPKVRVELPFEVVFWSLAADVNETVWIDGQNRYGTGMRGARTIGPNPHALHLYPTPKAPGTYKMEVRYTYKLRPLRDRTWQWNPAAGILLPRRTLHNISDSAARPPKYECNITVPVEITIARKVHLDLPQ